ncbi:MAG: hypothetical protein GF393_10575 [Armatimonadia bacterium]|nr:hypothetical protein [Armatimonadia bacterium]
MAKKIGIGCAIAAGIILLTGAVLAFMAYSRRGQLLEAGYRQYESTRRETARQEVAARDQIRRRQLELIAVDIDSALEHAEANRVDGALEALGDVDVQLEVVARSAEASGDTEQAAEIEELRGQVGAAIAEIDGASEGEGPSVARSAIGDAALAFDEYMQADQPGSQ